MKNFAIIRHKKIKAGRHLVSAGLHNARGIETKNAHKMKRPIEKLIGSNKPHRDVMKRLSAMGITKFRKNQNIAVEVVLAASPEWWQDKGWKPGEEPNEETLGILEEWKKANLEYLVERFGKNCLASVFVHYDEASPHFHALLVPAQFRKDGREKDGKLKWRLSTEKVLPGPMAMKQIVTDYCKQMEVFGLRRGEESEVGTTKHKPVKEWHADRAAKMKELEKMIEGQKALSDGLMEAARREAAAILSKAKLEVAETERNWKIAERKRADDEASFEKSMAREREKIQLENIALEKKKREVSDLKKRLLALLERAEVALKPILKVAAELKAASPLFQQAMGVRAKKAAEFSDSKAVEEMQALMAMRNQKDRG